MNGSIKTKLKKLPDAPGVYFFLARKKILYIGKATSLRDRVRSYFNGSIAETRSPLISKMIAEFDDIDFQKTDSVLEALILEANLIKKHQPPANTDEKDDKSFNYVVITKEKFPRVLLVRGHDLEKIRSNSLNSHHSHIGMSLDKQFGPFPHGSQLKEALRIIRKIFPYRDNKCTPYLEQKPHSLIPPLEQGRKNQGTHISRVPSPEQGEGRVGFPCFNRQIGLCPGVCTGEISAGDYKKQIRNIVLFFQGNKKQIAKNLEKEMKRLAKEREFEKANEKKRQLFALRHIQDVSLIKERKQENGESSFRIEGYDIAQISGTNVVGVMVAIENGQPQKSDYRKFKIRGRRDDVGALTEVLSRRLAHPEWPRPDLIVVDGGTAQKNAMEKVLAEKRIDIPVVAVVKDERHKPREIRYAKHDVRVKELAQKYEGEILLADAEAHRFAIGFHKHLRRKIF